MYSEKEVREAISKAVQGGISLMGKEWLLRELPLILNNWNIVDELYIPDEQLINRLSDFERWCKTKRGEDPGKLMEEVAFLALRCLKGYEVVKNYQSYAGQIDLVVAGSDQDWVVIMNYLHLDVKYRSIVVEAKNLASRVDDKQFSRFCYHLQNTFEGTAQLGIFFTRIGATGFPKSTKSTKETPRQRLLRDSQATQILFHAKTRKFVVVLEQEDILKLSIPGSLLRILESKIRGIEQWSGLNVDITDKPIEIDIPPHLLKHITKR